MAHLNDGCASRGCRSLRLWQDEGKPCCAGTGPQPCLLLDRAHGVSHGRRVTVKEAAVAVPPNVPGGEYGDGGKAASETARGTGDGRGEPGDELLVVTGDRGGGAAP